MNDADIIKAFDILDKFEFFGGQRAGRELWFNKPADIQDKDIGEFLRDLDFLKQFINRQKAEIEKLEGMVSQNEGVLPQYEALLESKAIKEFAERLKATFPSREDARCTLDDCYTLDCIDNLVKEMTEIETRNITG